ncbi:hypothetical protein GCM10027449_33440 [Sinomonas notoginsengisoli]
MSGSVWEGNPAAIALTVELAEADAEALPATVEDGAADVDDAPEAVAFGADPAAGPAHAAIANAAAAIAVVPASRRIRRVMSAIRGGCAFRLPVEVLPSLVGCLCPSRPTMDGWRRRTMCRRASRSKP